MTSVKRIYHGGYGDFKEVPSGGVFNGFFGSDIYDNADCHGEGVKFFADIDTSKILTSFELEYQLDADTTLKALRQAMPRLDDDTFKEYQDDIWKAVIEDKHYKLDSEVSDILFYDDGNGSWDAQRARGEVAATLGYLAVEMQDEHGKSYLMVPGVKLIDIAHEAEYDASNSLQSDNQIPDINKGDSMTRERIIASNETIKEIVEQEIQKYGNQADLNHIDVSNVTDMNRLFQRSYFIGDISQWDVSKVEKTTFMFDRAKFNGDISKWDVSNVKNMNGMFMGSEFNSDISNWDVSKVNDVMGIFNASDFNGNISRWNINPRNLSLSSLDDCPASESPTPGTLHFMCKVQDENLHLHPDIQAFYDFNAPVLDGMEPQDKARILATLYQERNQEQPLIDFTMGLEPSEQAMGSSGFSFDAPDEQSTGLSI